MEWSIQEIARAAGTTSRTLRHYGDVGLLVPNRIGGNVVRCQVQWLSVTTNPTRGYVIGLGELYVADPRFGEDYDRHGAGTAELVRAAMRGYAERHLAD